MTVKPVISVDPTSLDFGDVKVGTESSLKLDVNAASNVALHLSGLSVDGDMAFAFADAPDVVSALSSAPVTLKLKPSEVRTYQAELVIASDDEDHPQMRVQLSGRGATPMIEVTPGCTAPCMATVAATSIHFAPEPADRAVEPPVTIWPVVRIASTGVVPLDLNNVAVEGADAAAFKVLGIPPTTLSPSQHVDLPLKLDTVATQVNYQAELVIRSDDPAHGEIRIPLAGELRANLPPVVCANVTRVQPGDGSAPVDYGGWGPPPDAGYDFSQTREVQPNSVVELSAWSSADPLTCTTDPEDERIALTYLWEVVSAPPGPAAALTGASTAIAHLVPIATGTYLLRLTVRDVQGHATAAELTLWVAVKQDLVAQLSWTSDPGADLDVHLVRPGSSPFSFFEEGDAGRTSGDINGWAQLARTPDSGYDFAWGDVGPSDDPKLNVDDTGSGALLENVSLNYPEHAPQCAASECTYQVLVHWFRDARDAGASAPAACDVSGCRDGETCTCSAGSGCVANVAPLDDAGVGAGTCRAPVRPVVRVFVKANATPAAVVPLDTLMPVDAFGLGAPCELWHVADVVWPRRGADAGTVRVDVIGRDDAGYLTRPLVQRWGWRPNPSGQCVPNVVKAGKPWFAPVP
jgi:hypothetical protein